MPFVQPGTEIASERHVSCLRLGQARLNLREPASRLTEPLLAKPESGVETPFQDPVPEQRIHELFRLEDWNLELGIYLGFGVWDLGFELGIWSSGFSACNLAGPARNYAP